MLLLLQLQLQGVKAQAQLQQTQAGHGELPCTASGVRRDREYGGGGDLVLWERWQTAGGRR